ncbi:MAG: hypothetical protein JWO08_3289 [Verrucomicrobiaceae bacterium]|nr:hypothetical protein [Verrucomicrobiaceae bacterium]
MFLWAFLGAGLWVNAKAESAVTPNISVSGTAVTEVRPDQMNWSIEVRNTGLELAKVADKHATVTSAVLTLLKQLGVEDKNLQTTEVELGRNVVYRNNESVEEGYFASTMVSFTLTNMAGYKEVWLKLANQSGVSVKGVTLDHSKRIELTKETRIKALHAAREKAIAMAGALDTKVGEVLTISEDIFAGLGRANNMSFNNVAQTVQRTEEADEGGGSMAPGRIPIRVKVNVTFRLLNEGK